MVLEGDRIRGIVEEVELVDVAEEVATRVDRRQRDALAIHEHGDHDRRDLDAPDGRLHSKVIDGRMAAAIEARRAIEAQEDAERRLALRLERIEQRRRRADRGGARNDLRQRRIELLEIERSAAQVLQTYPAAKR